MSDVLIRDVPSEDLDQIRVAAADRGISVQRYLREAVHAEAVHLRRQAAISRTSTRLGGRLEVPADERRAVLEAIDSSHEERAEHLLGRREE
ncbi:MAG: hypothetical protein H0T91_12965 [Propionibacteriaceae bacterium]|nr:hypothetical protein [Propionibacteriaceae bacterium]